MQKVVGILVPRYRKYSTSEHSVGLFFVVCVLFLCGVGNFPWTHDVTRQGKWCRCGWREHQRCSSASQDATQLKLKLPDKYPASVKCLLPPVELSYPDTRSPSSLLRNLYFHLPFSSDSLLLSSYLSVTISLLKLLRDGALCPKLLLQHVRQHKKVNDDDVSSLVDENENVSATWQFLSFFPPSYICTFRVIFLVLHKKSI